MSLLSILQFLTLAIKHFTLTVLNARWVLLIKPELVYHVLVLQSL
jgi:hypothetical protein